MAILTDKKEEKKTVKKKKKKKRQGFYSVDKRETEIV